RGPEWISLLGPEPRQAGRRRELDDGLDAAGPLGPIGPSFEPGAVDRSPDWIGHASRAPGPAAGGLDRVERAFPTVSERREPHRVAPADEAPAVGDRSRDLDGGERALERIRGDEDDQLRSLAARSVPRGSSRRSFQ